MRGNGLRIIVKFSNIGNIMKNVFLISVFCFFIVNFINAQDNTSIWGLKYGTSILQVEKIVEKEKGLKGYKSDSETMDLLIYTDCSFAGETAEYISFIFSENKLVSSTAKIVPKKTKVISTFSTFYSNLTKKYGAAFTKSYDESVTEATLLRRLKSGSGKVEALWMDADQRYSIYLKVNEEYEITLTYSDAEAVISISDKITDSNLEDL